MSKLINELYPRDEQYDESSLEECGFEITYEPMVNKKTGDVELLLEVYTCVECGEQWVNEVFTDGSIQAELIAREMGYREEFNDFREEN